MKEVYKTAGMGVGGCALVLALAAGAYALSAWLVMLLWNWLIPAIFHGPTISYWMALGLLVLVGVVASIVTGGSK